MVLTDSTDLVERVRGLREYDGLPADFLRFNYKMTDVAATMGRVQFKRLPAFIERRREIAAHYDRSFVNLPLDCPLQEPEHIYYRYVIRTAREAGVLIGQLERNGVAARRPIYQPLHRELGEEDAVYPQTGAAFKADVSLPIYPSQSDAEVEQVIKAVVHTLGSPTE